MNRFTPVMCHEPSACCTALVRPAPTSEPASGSLVSTMVAPHWRSIMICAVRFWSRFRGGPDRGEAGAGHEHERRRVRTEHEPLAAQRSDGGGVVPPRWRGRSRFRKPDP